MKWPYQFLHLDAAGKHERRVLLDRYGLYAQLSAFIPIIVVLIFRLTYRLFDKMISKKLSYGAVPMSLSEISSKQTTSFCTTKRLQPWLWWLTNDIEIWRQKWGRIDQLIIGGIWVAWLLFLCVNETGNDYFLLTRKFGAIGASQLPVQYLLSMKRLNLVAFAFRTSHENINRWHRVLGWISYFLIFLHGILYINYYVQVGGLGAAFFRVVPVLGMLGLLGMVSLSVSTMKVIRQYSYRIFFITHFVVALALPPIIWFHVPHGRIFMGEAMVALIVDIGARRFCALTCLATIDMIPGTSLIRVIAELPAAKLRGFATRPASHAYLSVPKATFFPFGLLSNPFTVSSVNEETGHLTFIARRMNGPTTLTLARLASESLPGTKVNLRLDGPYGAAAYFPDLVASFDKVLLVAGGVGATFILPLYQHITNENPDAQVQLVWAAREVEEVGWSTLVGKERKIQVFLTGNRTERNFPCTPIGSSEELGDIELAGLEKANQRAITMPLEKYRRPDLQAIVDEFLGQGAHDRTAVVICGPAAMASELRKAVGTWIQKGRNVWFHSEDFTW